MRVGRTRLIGGADTEDIGYEDVAVLDGWLKAWTDASLPTSEHSTRGSKRALVRGLTEQKLSSFVRDPCASGRKTAVFDSRQRSDKRIPEQVICR